MRALFSSSYLPPISYLQRCILSEKIYIDPYEHFIKQTFRNRCNIYGPNGMQRLVIPVVHKNLFRTPVKDVRISNETSWNKIHWKSICSAYRNSPFFEFYEDDFRKIFDRPPEYLFEFNLELFQLILRLFKIDKEISFMKSYEKNHEDLVDLRNFNYPGVTVTETKPYYQVFSERHGFISDLSCIDLLFNTGSIEI